jgi:hypothetical protein
LQFKAQSGDRIARGAVVVLALAYLVQAATPLRLHADSIVLLSLAENAAHGGGFLYYGHTTVYPPGYPAVVAVLLRLGLPYVWALIGLNAAGLFLGLWAIRYLLVRRFSCDAASVRNICVLSLLSFVFVKFFAIPLTDICFFGIAMCCLAVMESASELGSREFLWRVLGGWILVAAAIAVRRVGVALIPPLIGTILLRAEVRGFVRRASILTRIAGIVCAACAGGLIVWLVARTSTLSDFRRVMAGHGPIDAASQILGFRFRELGEMAVNLPFAMSPAAQATLPVIGLLAAALAAAGFWAKRYRLGPTEIFVFSYVLVLLFWPFYDARFWLPVIPLLIAYAGMAIERLIRRSLWRRAVQAYLMLYATLGVLTLVSSTMVTFSGRNFPNVYRDEPYQATYCAVYGTCTDSTATIPVDEAALHVYKTYR